MLHTILNLTRPLLIFDFESTGKDPEVARACSIGLRLWKPDGSVLPYKSLINPTIGIPQDVSDKSHKITDDIIRTGCSKCRAPEDAHPHAECDEFRTVPRFVDLAARLYDGFRDSDFAGYNIRYDLKLAQAEFKRCGIDFDYSKAAIIDSLRLWQLLEPRTLSDAVEHFLQRKLIGAHDAMLDVLGTEEVLIGQLTHHPRSHTLPRSVRELHELSWPGRIDVDGKFAFNEQGVPCFNFGKWKDDPMADHRDYLYWMVNKGDFSAEVKRIANDALQGRFPILEEKTT